MSTYSWSYAPTSRAQCKGGCMEKIQKGAVRLAHTYDEHWESHCTTYTSTDYICLACAVAKHIPKITSAVGGVELVQGFDSLAVNDQAEILEKAGKTPNDQADILEKAGKTLNDQAEILEKAGNAPKPKAKAKGKAATPEPKANAKGKASPPGPKAKAKGKAAPKREAKASVKKEHEFLDKAKNFDLEGVKAMVEEFPGIVCAQPAGRWSALHQFAAAGNVSAVKYLLEKGADKTCKAKDGATPKDNAKHTCKALLEAEEVLPSGSKAKAARAPPPAKGEPPKKAAKGGC